MRAPVIFNPARSGAEAAGCQPEGYSSSRLVPERTSSVPDALVEGEESAATAEEIAANRQDREDRDDALAQSCPG